VEVVYQDAVRHDRCRQQVQSSALALKGEWETHKRALPNCPIWYTLYRGDWFAKPLRCGQDLRFREDGIHTTLTIDRK
jgi:hypothetical protein